MAQIEAVQGSLDDKVAVAKAYAGAEALLYVLPPSTTHSDVFEYNKTFGRITCDAIDKQNVKRVVYISGTGFGYDMKAGGVAASYYVEEMIDGTFNRIARTRENSSPTSSKQWCETVLKRLVT